jgi:hypothetical protein
MTLACCKIRVDFMYSPRGTDANLETAVGIATGLPEFTFFFLIRLVAGGVQLGPLGTAATDWPIVACPG